MNQLQLTFLLFSTLPSLASYLMNSRQVFISAAPKWLDLMNHSSQLNLLFSTKCRKQVKMMNNLLLFCPGIHQISSKWEFSDE